MRAIVFFALVSLSVPASQAAPKPGTFLEKYCVECHDTEVKKGGLDLTGLKLDLGNSTNFNQWIAIHDRVSLGEMPPKKKTRPDANDLEKFTNSIAAELTAVEKDRLAREGRATQRRLNRYEYENALRDLLHAPWLQIRDTLPEDGEAYRFNKVGDALDVSHVQMARYLNAADYALRQVIAKQASPPPAKVTRYYTRDQRSYTGPMTYTVFNTAPERATFPVLGFEAQPDVRASKAPITSTNVELRELEGVGVVASSYEPIEPKFNKFRAPTAGRYKLRFNGYSVWVGPGPTNKWFIPDLDTISKGRRSEPVTIYSDRPPGLLRRLGEFDVTPEPEVKELDVWLLAGETIKPDPARLFRSRPGASRWQNPLAEKDGQPGVVFRWLEVEGPLHDEWPEAGHKLLFGNLPIKTERLDGPDEIVPGNPRRDAERLLKNFVKLAYRRPEAQNDYKRFLPVFEMAFGKGVGFTEAMIAAYTAVLCSPEFICVEEKPGRLDDSALATRLSFFLWNSIPDAELRASAERHELRKPDALRAQTERMLNDPKSRRFVDAFLDYWLDLRRMSGTAPDGELYPDYYLDDLLTESAQMETQLFFAELLKDDLPVRNLISSDFAMLNERLAVHYGLPPFEGVEIRRVELPKESPRGGLMTQASILKVTANGTTTSPVLRGAWIMERILGQKPPPPPASVPAVDPDIRGAVTIRQQLDKHRTQETCNACHAKMDPAGFALENFDVMGGWRDFYRAQGGTEKPLPGLGKNGQKFAFHAGLPVDASGEMPDGRKFSNIREFKQLLLKDEMVVARNLVKQLTIYATGAPVRFSDRAEVSKLLVRASASHYGVRTLVHEVVQSELFLRK
jgi:hypothetical protein